jgi:hypothetical protein
LALDILIKALDAAFDLFKQFNDLLSVALVIFFSPTVIFQVHGTDVGVIKKFVQIPFHFLKCIEASDAA